MATMESINAKANAGLATGIVGTSLGAIATGVLNGNGNGLLGGIFGGNPAQNPAYWNNGSTDVLAAMALMSAYNRPCGCEATTTSLATMRARTRVSPNWRPR